MANAFETELAKSFKALGWWHHKLSVSTSLSSKLKRFTGRAPFDFTAYAPVEGTGLFLPIGIEAKSTRNLGSLPFARVEKHQVEGLEYFAGCGAPAYVAINFRKPKNVCWLIRIEDWVALSDLFRNKHNRKSIPKYRFNSPPFIPIERVKINGVLSWDLTPVLKDIGRNKCTHSNHSAVSSSSESRATRRRSLRAA